MHCNARVESMEWPSPKGLLLGFAFVLVGQAVVLAYYFVRRVLMHERNYLQYKPPPVSTLKDDLVAHGTPTPWGCGEGGGA